MSSEYVVVAVLAVLLIAVVLWTIVFLIKYLDYNRKSKALDRVIEKLDREIAELEKEK